MDRRTFALLNALQCGLNHANMRLFEEGNPTFRSIKSASYFSSPKRFNVLHLLCSEEMTNRSVQHLRKRFRETVDPLEIRWFKSTIHLIVLDSFNTVRWALV